MKIESISVESQIHLNKFKPRPWQKDAIIALEEKNFKRMMLIWPRRSGKDICAFNMCIRACLKRVGTIFYVFPTFSSGRRILWDAVQNDGMRVLDYIPKELIESKNEQQMRIKFINGSILQIIGSDNYDNTLVGVNAMGIVFSEYALTDERAYSFSRPILSSNNGFACFISTPRGKNHLWALYQIALMNPSDWYVSLLTVEDTNHIPMHEIQRELASGEMSEDMVAQEYYCSFTMGVEGSYYAKYLDKMRLKGQISCVPFEASSKVFTVWDIGVRDSTCIIFFQIIGQTVRIIDCYERAKEGLEHYVKVLESKAATEFYSYSKHFAPHDMRVQEFGSGITRLEKARQLGINFTMAGEVSILDGIEAVRSAFSKIWIDETKCKPLIKALENYRQEWDGKRKVYKGNPLHDWSSHFCFTGDTLILTRNGMRQIMLIEQDEEVLTLEGWYKCSRAIKTQINATVVEVSFNDGMRVRCTPDHLFLTTNGWKSADKLMKNTKIQSSLMNLTNTLWDHCIVYGQMRSIFLAVEKGSIERYGNKLMEKYQEIVTYIIETMIPLTTISGISNVYQKKSILNFLDRITKDFQQLRGIKQPSGIDQTKEDYGISNMLKKLKIGRSGLNEQCNAFCVNQALRVLCDEMAISKNSVTRTARQLIIVGIKEVSEKQDVYDISVPGVRHFSLSNGAVVHNSDAMRYLCVSLPKTRDGSSGADIERNYREAMLGSQSEMPAMFRDEKDIY